MQHTRRRKILLGLANGMVFLAIFLMVLIWGPGRRDMVPATSAETPQESPLAGYSGSLSCRECHERFHELWETSHHGRAMQPYTAELARTELSPQTEEIVIGDYRYLADIDGPQGWVSEYGPEGETQYPIVHLLGGKNVYYFLTPIARGRLQTLPVAYDLRRQRWFDTAGSGVRHFNDRDEDDPYHWTDPVYTFNTSCYGCHVSQMVRNYDVASDTYNTVWVEPGINCETCHGPAEDHITVWKETPEGERPADQKIIRGGRDFTTEQQNSVCSSCHAKMSPLSDLFPPGDLFFDHYDLVTLEHPDYYPDGRDLGENYTYTTWRMSPCAQAGQLDCLDCHTSSGRYQFNTKETANNACAPCHQQRVENPEPHTHHPASNPDAPTCVSCHMPTTGFARMNRSDHSMRPPTPITSREFGSPTACTLCHSEYDAEWADQEVRQWHKHNYQAPYLYQARLVDAARNEDWSRLPEMLAYVVDDDRDEVVANSLVRLLNASEDERKWPVLLQVLQDDPSPLMRSSAASALEQYLIPETVEALVNATHDPFRLVRVRAAASLARVSPASLNEEQRTAVEQAMEEFITTMTARPDDYSAHYNLGNFFMDQGRYHLAIDAYAISANLRSDFIPPLVNASLAFNAMGQNALAEERLRNALTIDPESAAANFNLGLLLGEQGRLAEAETALRNAFTADPTSAATAYNLGVMIAKERLDEAIEWCRKAVELRPQDPKYAYTLAYFLQQHGETEEAITLLQTLIQQQPGYGDAYGLLGSIYETLERVDDARALYEKALATEELSARSKSYFATKLKALPSN